MAGRSTESQGRTTSSGRKGSKASLSRSTKGGSGRSTSAKSRKQSARSSVDGLTGAERKHLSRPFDTKVLAEATEIARTYRLVIEEDPDVGYVGSTVEMPLVMGGGKTVQACVRDVLEATAGTIATMLERGEAPPAPARDAKRDRQVNIRLSAEEKMRLEEAARREGFRSLSDYLRAAGLNRAG